MNNKVKALLDIYDAFLIVIRIFDSYTAINTDGKTQLHGFLIFISIESLSQPLTIFIHFEKLGRKERSTVIPLHKGDSRLSANGSTFMLLKDL